MSETPAYAKPAAPPAHAPAAPGALQRSIGLIINICTLVAVLFGGITVLVGGGAGYQRLVGKIDEHTKWIAEHDTNAKDRRGEVEADLSRIATMVGSLDDRLDTEEAMTTRLSDRISAAEARGAELSQTLREVQTSLNEQRGDLKVILAWIDEQRRIPVKK